MPSSARDLKNTKGIFTWMEFVLTRLVWQPQRYTSPQTFFWEKTNCPPTVYWRPPPAAPSASATTVQGRVTLSREVLSQWQGIAGYQGLAVSAQCWTLELQAGELHPLSPNEGPSVALWWQAFLTSPSDIQPASSAVKQGWSYQIISHFEYLLRAHFYPKQLLLFRVQL